METNIYLIKIDFDNYQLSRTTYTDEKLKELKSKYNNTHSFFRNEEYIYISNKEGDDAVVLGDISSVGTYGNQEITSSLIKHLFFRTFKERFPTIKPIDFYPFRIFSTQKKDDLVYELLPDKLKDVLSFKKEIEVQLRLITIGDKQNFGFVINTSRRWFLNKNCKDLKNEGFNLIDAEVLESEIFPGMENILASNEEFIGIIKAVNESTASVETNSGLQEIALESLSLRRTKANMQEYLAYATSLQESDKIFKHIEQLKVEILNPKNEREEIKRTAKLLALEKNENGGFSSVLYQNKDGFCFTIDPNPYTPSNSFELKTPTFIFDPAATKTNSRSPDFGLNDFGPYDSLNFDVKSPFVLAICAKENRGYFTQFLANLTDGLPQSTWFKKGLKKKYDLLDVTFNVVEISSYDFSEYQKAININGDKKPDLAIIEIPEEFRKLEDSQNPYFKLKAKLLTLGIPIQFVTSRKIKNHDENILNAMSLQIYAKLGGSPWVLPSARSVDREIIIGIGHTILRKNTYSNSDKNRVVGITTFFSGDGQYLLSNKAKDVPYEEYFNELLVNLKDSFTNLEGIQGWKEGDTIRLIFHIFKPIRNVEFEVISSLIKTYPKYKIQFAFVTVSKHHPFVLFDINQEGVRRGYKTVGTFVPDRGTNLILDSTSCLVQMLGAKQIKTDFHGVSSPMLIRIRVPQGKFNTDSIDEFLFTDLQYIVQQIYSFTYLSWRSFLPREDPATMLYSNLISVLLGKLRKVEGWDANALNLNLKRKKWFL
jgi:hypothetical protein